MTRQDRHAITAAYSKALNRIPDLLDELRLADWPAEVKDRDARAILAELEGMRAEIYRLNALSGMLNFLVLLARADGYERRLRPYFIARH